MEHIENVGVCSVCSTLARRVFVSRSAHFRWGFRMCGFVCGCQLVGGRTPSLRVGAMGNVYARGESIGAKSCAVGRTYRYCYRSIVNGRKLSACGNRRLATVLLESPRKTQKVRADRSLSRCAGKSQLFYYQFIRWNFQIDCHAFLKRRRGRLMASEGTSTRNK